MSSKCYIWRCVESTFDLKNSGFRVVVVAGKACDTIISGAQTFLFESGKALAPIAGRLPLFE
jgi:hypothetical protein